MEEAIETRNIPISEARQHLGELVKQVYRRQVRVVLEKSGISVAVLVSPADLDHWTGEDRASAREAELARRKALVETVLANAKTRVIVPLTSADLVHEARAEREEAYERWVHPSPGD